MTSVLNLTKDNFLDCQQGADYVVPIQWQNSDTSVITIAGVYRIKMQVKNRYGGLVLVELTTENGGIEIDSAENIVLLILAAVTTTFEPGTYVYDLKLIPISTGRVIRFLEGEFEVTPEVTT